MTKLLTLLKSDVMKRSLHMLPQLKHFPWLVLDARLIFVSQVPTHAQLDTSQVIEEAK
jgi:hypothetical protein